MPLFLDRLAFGLLAAVLVWRTGGLEARMAAHVVNNVFAYVVAGLTSSIAALKAIRAIGWLDAVFDIGGFARCSRALALLVAVKLRAGDPGRACRRCLGRRAGPAVEFRPVGPKGARSHWGIG